MILDACRCVLYKTVGDVREVRHENRLDENAFDRLCYRLWSERDTFECKEKLTFCHQFKKLNASGLITFTILNSWD
jgi:hypothetical protein